MTGSRPDQVCDPALDAAAEATPKATGVQQFPFAGLHGLFIVAHADDEVLAAGARSHTGALR
jgi:hypothetical protein